MNHRIERGIAWRIGRAYANKPTSINNNYVPCIDGGSILKLFGWIIIGLLIFCVTFS